MDEAGLKGFEVSVWHGLYAPKSTPKPVVDRLNRWFNQVLATEEAKTFLNSFGGDPFISTPDEAQALFRQQVKEWEGFVRAARIEPQ